MALELVDDGNVFLANVLDEVHQASEVRTRDGQGAVVVVATTCDLNVGVWRRAGGNGVEKLGNLCWQFFFVRAAALVQGLVGQGDPLQNAKRHELDVGVARPLR